MTVALLALLLATASAGDPPEPAGARFVVGVRAVGYAAEVERACPGWRRVPAPEMARRGLLPRAGLMGLWGYDGPLHDAYWAGMDAARRDRAAHPDFCADPARWRRNLPVARAIERVADAGPFTRRA